MTFLLQVSIDATTLFYGVVGVFACLLMVLLYYFVVRPKREYVFAGERKCGVWTLALSRLGRIAVGPVCTARQTYEALFSQTSINAIKMRQGCDDKTPENLSTLTNDIFENVYLYAQKSQDGDILYLFDQNPEDEKFYTALGEERFITAIQDCKSWPKDEYGLARITVKLGAETSKYTIEEDKYWEQKQEAVKWIRTTASNSTEIAHLKGMLETKDLLMASKDEQIRRQTTRADTATTAAGIKSLEEPSIPPEKPNILGAISRKFLSRSQIIVGLISIAIWFAVTNILHGLSIVIPDPSAMGILIGIAVFFGIPIIRGWLSERRQR